MARVQDMKYSLEITWDDDETIFCSLFDEIHGRPDTRKLITSYRSKSVDDALYMARGELGTLIGLDYWF